MAFEALTAGKVVCAADPHVLAERFPAEGFWEYCCDCQRLWPSELKHGGQAQTLCPVCERRPARRFLCGQCGVMSVASDDKHTRRRPHSIDASGAVVPDCPGCRAAAPASVRAHECETAGVSFRTARAACPFCEEPLDEKARPEAGQSFPTRAAALLSGAGKGAQIVRADYLRSILVKDPEGVGEFSLIHDWGVPGGVLYLIPRVTRFQTRQEYYNYYDRFYECASPTVGEVWVVRPALAGRVSGGWSLLEKGILEVRDGTPNKPPPKTAPKVETKSPPKVEAKSPPKVETKSPPKVEAKVQAQTQAKKQAAAPSPAPPRAAPPAAPPPAPPTQRARPEPPREQPRVEPPPAAPRPEPPRASAEPARRAVASTVITPAPTGAVYRVTKTPETPAPGRRRFTVWVAVVLTVVTIAFVVITLATRIGRVLPNRNVAPPPSSTPAGGTPESPTAGGPPPGMVLVPGGTFRMGSNFEQFEQPPHDVAVAPFYIDEHEVTCEEYAAFVSATGHRSPPSWKGGRMPEGRARFPVTGVDWDDAGAYAKWAGKRLPTEEEWEFAARGTDGRRYPWGDVWRADAANAQETSRESAAGASLTEVMKHPTGASPFGVHDMSGNAWEWTASDFAVYPGGDASLLANQTAGKVIRGGCYLTGPAEVTTTYRGKWPARRGKTYDQTGFRCAMDAPNR